MKNSMNIASKEKKINGKNKFLRFFTSHTALCFFYGTFLLLVDCLIVGEYIAHFHYILIAWTAFISLYDFFIRKIWRKIPFSYLILFFFCSVAITSGINIRTGLVGNFKALVMTCLPLCAFLPTFFISDEIDRKKIIFALSGAMFVVFIASTIALVMFFMQLQYPTVHNGKNYIVGINCFDPFLLRGIYKDTNFAAGYIICSIGYSVMLISAYRDKIFASRYLNISILVFAIVNLIFQICYFPLVNSRGGWLALFCSLFISVCMYCRPRFKVNKVLALLVSILIGILFVLAVYGVGTGIRFCMISFIDKSVEEVYVVADKVGNIHEENIHAEISADDAEVDFSKNRFSPGSGRLYLWADAIKIFKHYPIMGINNGNSVYYSKDIIPYSPLARGTTVHNSYLDVLVDYGIVGAGLLFSFFIICAVRVFKAFFNGQIKSDIFNIAILDGIIALAIVSFFISSTFNTTTFMYYLLLCMIGYILSIISKKN